MDDILQSMNVSNKEDKKKKEKKKLVLQKVENKLFVQKEKTNIIIKEKNKNIVNNINITATQHVVDDETEIILTFN